MNAPATIAEAVEVAIEDIAEGAEQILGDVEQALKNAIDEVGRWRSAFAAEVEAHNETKNILAGTKRQHDAAIARASALEVQHGTTSRRLSAAKTMLEGAGLVMPEEPKHTGEWYSCAVCSTKTDATPSVTRRHACCGRNAYLGPCCHAAIERSPEDVEAIMAGGGHAAGCRGESR